MTNGFLVEIYNFLYAYFFAGELPAILVPIAPELCAVLSLIVMGFAFAPIIIVLVCLWRFFTSFAGF